MAEAAIDPIQITRQGHQAGLGYALVCSGYLVERGKVLLVHHNGFNKWVPPGGHIEAGDTFADTVVREFREETGLDVAVLSLVQPLVSDDNATPLPVPFYVDLEREGFAIPAIVQFFYVQRSVGSESAGLVPQESEVHAVEWFDLDTIDTIETFEQVRVLAKYAIRNHPSSVRQ